MCVDAPYGKGAMGLTCKAAPAAKPLSERKVVRERTLKVDGKRGNGQRMENSSENEERMKILF